uniref:HTH OST-type domain-containing protein n=1 Tax=Meloidogyne hapla TaxID=6305 RepID=A0A1I8B1I2_MELHA
MARSQSFFDAELPNDPSSSNQHIPNIDYDDEDIGLDYDEYGVEVNEANGLDYDDEDDVGLSAHGQYVEEEDEDDEIGLDRMPPLPDDDDIFGDHNTSTPAPQDPTITSTNNNLMKVPFNEFAKEVVYTLASKVSGYCNLHELKEDLRKDTGLLPDYVVAHYGFANFEIFMKSELMQPSVKLQIIDGKHYFLPRNCSTFSHIRNEQEIERAATLLNQNREENEKLCRALLPENKEATINGRKLISELVYELGGEEKPVAWQEVQKKYKEKFNEELAGEALKRMFTRDKAIKILETLFTYEMELWQANLPGQFFLKLKMPFNDLVNYYEEELRNHNEAKAQMKNVSGRPMRPRINNHKYPKVFPTCPLYPTFDNPHPPPPPVQQAVNNKKSLDVPNNDVNNSNQLNMPTSSNAATKKSKFDISPEELGISTKKQSFTEMINCEEDDIAEESKITVKYNRKGWAEESSVPAYEIGGGGEKTSRLDPPINVGTNAVQNGGEGAKEDDNKKNKKTRYTSRIAGGDFTDSDEESGDDEDEVVSIKKLPKEERPVEIPKPQSVGENLTSFVPQQAPTSSNNIFVPPPRLSGHRAGIHKFMQEKVEQRKIEGTTSQPQQPNPPPFNPTKQRYPVNYSSDEEDDDVNNIFNEKQMSKEKSVENVVGRSVQQQQGGTSVNCTNTAALFDPPPSLPQQQQQPSSRPLPTLSNTSINQQNNTNNSKSVHKDKNANEWLLIDKVEWLRNEANKQKMSHESRPDEGSFIFRKGNEVLVLTESDDRIRASKHCDGRIKWDAYFPKTEWKLFSITVLGLVYSFMLRGE